MGCLRPVMEGILIIIRSAKSFPSLSLCRQIWTICRREASDAEWWSEGLGCKGALSDVTIYATALEGRSHATYISVYGSSKTCRRRWRRRKSWRCGWQIGRSGNQFCFLFSYIHAISQVSRQTNQKATSKTSLCHRD